MNSRIILINITVVIMLLFSLWDFPDRYGHMSLKEFISTLNSPLEAVVKGGAIIVLIIFAYWFKAVRNK